MEKKLIQLLLKEGIEISKEEAKIVLHMSLLNDETYGDEPIVRSITKNGRNIRVKIEHVAGTIKNIEIQK